MLSDAGDNTAYVLFSISYLLKEGHACRHKDANVKSLLTARIRPLIALLSAGESP